MQQETFLSGRLINLLYDFLDVQRVTMLRITRPHSDRTCLRIYAHRRLKSRDTGTFCGITLVSF